MRAAFKQILVVLGIAVICVAGLALASDPSFCNAPAQTTILVPDGGSVVVPTSPLASRRNITVCSSPENAGTPLVKCILAYNLPDGGMPNPDGGPVSGVNNAGDVLRVSDCITYPTGSGQSLLCTSSQPTTYVTTLECQ